MLMKQAEDGNITANDWKCIVQRNLAFQRYVFRRAWGVYYGMTAAAIAIIIYLSMVGIDVVAGLVVGLTIVLALIVATGLLFRKAYRVVELRQTVWRNRWERRPLLLIWPLVIVFFFSVIVAAIFLPSYFYLILYATEIPLTLVAWFSLKLSFPEGTPVEGALAILSYVFIVVLSFVLTFIGEAFGISASTTLLWVAITLIFFFASIYALLHAPDELEVLAKE